MLKKNKDMSTSKNLGQVVGLYVGNTPPTNTLLIWYDNTPSQRCHKIYDPTTRLWDALNPEVVSNITYSEITNAARHNGLPIGKYYRITDRNNVLAIAITTTKIQYTDTLGNILVDDLGVNIQYHVTSSNLLIDDVAGVFDVNNRKLVFRFEIESTLDIDEDYILGKAKRNNVWKLVKYAWNTIVSKVPGNSITWNGGLFFNFNKALKDNQDKEGGVVSMTKYASDQLTLTQNINNVSKENQNILKTASNAIKNATADSEIYNKAFPSNPSLGGNAGELTRGQTLLNIINNVFRWINKFKYATGISISQGYKDATTPQYVNNNDNVETAIGKLQYHVKHTTATAALSEGWEPKDVNTEIEMPKAKDTLDEAFAKAVGKLNQLGEIFNGGVRSKGVTQYGSTTRRNGELNLEGGRVDFASLNYYARYGATNMYLKDSSTGLGLECTPLRFLFQSSDEGIYNIENGSNSPAVFKSTYSDPYNTNVALTAICTATTKRTFDALFSRLKCGVLTLSTVFLSQTTYTVSRSSLIVSNAASGTVDIYLPSFPESGTMILICQSSRMSINVHAQGNDQIDTINESKKSVSINERGAIFAFIYIEGVRYETSATEGNEANVNGLWQYAKWTRMN